MPTFVGPSLSYSVTVRLTIAAATSSVPPVSMAEIRVAILAGVIFAVLPSFSLMASAIPDKIDSVINTLLISVPRIIPDCNSVNHSLHFRFCGVVTVIREG